jgi:two-component system chemotaxis sensor kinase CheA
MIMETKVFDNLLEPIFIVDKDKFILYCNEAASSLCEISVRKLMRQKQALNDVFRFAGAIDAFTNISKVQSPTSYQELAFTIESGKTGKVQISMQPFSDTSWLVYFHDVTLEDTLQSKYRAELQKKEDVISDLQTAQTKLKHYSENLEIMVKERTSEISDLNRTMSALLNSLSQGFFIFNQEGTCANVYSEACLSTIEVAPAGKKLWDVLRLNEKETTGLKRWMQTIFSEMLPFEDLATLGPQQYQHSKGHHIQLEYHPLKSVDQKISSVVVVSTDITSLVEAQLEAERERQHAKMILSLITHRRQFSNFLRETEAILSHLTQSLETTNFDFDSAFRSLHTMKGGFATFAVQSLVDVCHEAETLLTKWKDQPTPKNFQELKAQCLEIPRHFSQFLTENRALITISSKTAQRWVEIPAERLVHFAANPLLSPILQTEFLMDFIMEPVSHFVSHYEEMMQQMAVQEGKLLLPLEILNGDVRVLPEPYEALFNSLLHAYRNAVDHGIETADVREALQKPPSGKVQTSFFIESDASKKWLVIQVQDDGGGIPVDKLKSKLTSQGISCHGLSDHEVIQHVFDSQLSTKESVSQSSGRGVGMDAILFAAQEMGGTAWVDSVPNQGTVLNVRVPYFEKMIDQLTAKAHSKKVA